MCFGIRDGGVLPHLMFNLTPLVPLIEVLIDVCDMRRQSSLHPTVNAKLCLQVPFPIELALQYIQHLVQSLPHLTRQRHFSGPLLSGDSVILKAAAVHVGVRTVANPEEPAKMRPDVANGEPAQQESFERLYGRLSRPRGDPAPMLVTNGVEGRRGRIV